MTRDRFVGCRCLITGASSGLGRGVAVALGGSGAELLLTGRSPAGLSETVRQAVEAGARQEKVHVCQADLTKSEDRAQLFGVVREVFEGLDLLVNCAGVGAYGRFESHEAGVLRAILEINVIAQAEVSRLALPFLRNGERPCVVNIGSIVARRGLPGRSEYSASKHAMAALSESLRAEWKIDGIHVLLVNPGWSDTAFETNVLVDTAFVKTRQRRSMTSEQVAKVILRGVRRKKNEITLSASGRLLLLANRLAPRFVDWGLGIWTRRLYRRSGLG